MSQYKTHHKEEYQPLRVAVRSKALVYGRSFAVIAGSNTPGRKNVCLFCVMCVVGASATCGPSPKGILQSVNVYVCVCVCVCVCICH